jgi:hypothetical protein
MSSGAVHQSCWFSGYLARPSFTVLSLIRTETHKVEKKVAVELEAPAQKATIVEVQSSSTVEAPIPKQSTESVEEGIEATIELTTKKPTEDKTEKAKAGTSRILLVHVHTRSVLVFLSSDGALILQNR